jgi:putative nucleotidyltransferase with HDIG domain
LNEKRKAASLLFAIAVISTAHYTVGTSRQLSHTEHVVLEALYLVPILASALWFSLWGALIVTAATSTIYYFYVRSVWPNQPMENVRQMTLLVIFWFVGLATGILVHVQEKERLANQAAKERERRESVVRSLSSLSAALRLRDDYTREHSERVSRLSVEIGRRLDLNPERLEQLRLAGLMHDIGKIGIRDDILLKADQLSTEERQNIERHPVMAADILRPIEGAAVIADIVSAHHECPDGSGYPSHLVGSTIPLESRILRVADVYSSLTDHRPYKAGLELDSALSIMREMVPAKIDKEAFELLLQLAKERNPAIL